MKSSIPAADNALNTAIGLVEQLKQLRATIANIEAAFLAKRIEIATLTAERD